MAGTRPVEPFVTYECYFSLGAIDKILCIGSKINKKWVSDRQLLLISLRVFVSIPCIIIDRYGLNSIIRFSQKKTLTNSVSVYFASLSIDMS